MGYVTRAWAGFGGALAAVAGALTGLLFVAVSLKSDLLARSRNLASRAAQALVLFMIAVAGLTLLIGAGSGLFWLIPATAASLTGGVTSAWLLLIRVTG